MTYTPRPQRKANLAMADMGGGPVQWQSETYAKPPPGSTEAIENAEIAARAAPSTSTVGPALRALPSALNRQAQGLTAAFAEVLPRAYRGVGQLASGIGEDVAGLTREGGLGMVAPKTLGAIEDWFRDQRYAHGELTPWENVTAQQKSYALEGLSPGVRAITEQVGYPAAATIPTLAAISAAGGVFPPGQAAAQTGMMPAAGTAAATGQKAVLLNAARIAALKAISEPGDIGDRAKVAATTFTYMATPALSGLASSTGGAIGWDIAFNQGITHALRAMNPEQQVSAVKDPSLWFSTIMDVLMSLGTVPLAPQARTAVSPDVRAATQPQQPPTPKQAVALLRRVSDTQPRPEPVQSPQELVTAMQGVAQRQAAQKAELARLQEAANRILGKEADNASGLREDAGQVRETGNVAEVGAEKGGANLEQQAQGRADSGQGQAVAPPEPKPAPKFSLVEPSLEGESLSALNIVKARVEDVLSFMQKQGDVQGVHDAQKQLDTVNAAISKKVEAASAKVSKHITQSAPQQVAKQPWEMTGRELVQAVGSTPESKRASGIEPWHVTRQQAIEYAQLLEREQRGGYRIPGGVDDATATIHKRAVEYALSEGKPVPAEVLKDYPDLAEKYGKAEKPKFVPISSMGGVSADILARAANDWQTRKLYRDNAGNWRLSSEPASASHRPKGPIAPYNKELKAGKVTSDTLTRYVSLSKSGAARLPGSADVRNLTTRINERVADAVTRPLTRLFGKLVPERIKTALAGELARNPEAHQLWQDYRLKKYENETSVAKFLRVVAPSGASAEDLRLYDHVIRGVEPSTALPAGAQEKTWAERNRIRAKIDATQMELLALGVLSKDSSRLNWYPQHWKQHQSQKAFEMGGRIFATPRTTFSTAEKAHLKHREIALKGVEELYTVYMNGKPLESPPLKTLEAANATAETLQKANPTAQIRVVEPMTVGEAEAIGLISDPRVNALGIKEQGSLLAKAQLFDGLGRASSANISDEPGEGKVPFSSTGIHIPQAIVKRSRAILERQGPIAKGAGIARLHDGYIAKDIADVLTGAFGNKSGVMNWFVENVLVRPQRPLRAAVTWGNPVRHARQFPENDFSLMLTDMQTFASPSFRVSRIKARVALLAGKTPDQLAETDKYWAVLVKHAIPEETYVGHVTGEGRAETGWGDTGKVPLAERARNAPVVGKAVKAADWIKTQYGATDLSHKYALVKKYMQDGMTEKQAIAEMENHTFNWRDMPTIVKQMNRLISFAPGVLYNMTRLASHQMASHPITAMLKIAVLTVAFMELRRRLYKKAGITERDLKMLGDTAPGYFEVPLGKDDRGRVVTWDMRWFMWFSDIGRFTATDTKDLPAATLNWLPMHLKPVVAAAMGYTRYGQPMREEVPNMTERDKKLRFVNEVYKGLTPGIFGDEWRRIYANMEAPEEYKKPWGEVAASRVAGTMRHLDPEKTASIEGSRIVRELRELKIAANALGRIPAESMTPAERARREQMMQRKLEELKQRRDKLVEAVNTP